MNDDIWISGQFEINEVKIWVTEAKEISGTSRNQGRDALGNETQQDKARVNVNNIAIKYLRETNGIWKN